MSTLVEIQNTLLVSVEYEGIEKRPDGRKDNFMPLCLQKTRRKALNTERTTLIYPDGGTHVGSAGQAVMVFGP